MDNKFLLGIIGAGNMASAIIHGALKKLLNPKDIIVSDLDENKLETLKPLGIKTTKCNLDVAENSKNILFAIKPQVSPIVFDEIKGKIKADTIMSIMAGVSISRLETLGNFNFVRIMPNTPAMLGYGMAAIAVKGNTVDKKFIFDLFNSLGKTVKLDESLFDAVTSISGSGPAYVYSFIKAMIDGGVDGGLSFEDAKTLTLQTIIGSCKMVEKNEKPIENLIEAVCSKGGTTIEAVKSFVEDDLNGIIRKGIKKCKNRSEELSRDTK